LTARSQFGQLLDQVADGHRSFVIEKRGTPKAVILGIQDYIRLAAPEPEILTAIGQASVKRGTDKLTERQIERIVKQARASRKHAAS
jgi:prevent-host-death family protein